MKKMQRDFEQKLSIITVLRMIYKEDPEGIKLFDNIFQGYIRTGEYGFSLSKNINDIATIARYYFKGYENPPTKKEIANVLYYLFDTANIYRNINHNH